MEFSGVFYGSLISKKSFSLSFLVNQSHLNHFTVSNISLAMTCSSCRGPSNVTLLGYHVLCYCPWCWTCFLGIEDRGCQWVEGWWLLGLAFTVHCLEESNLGWGGDWASNYDAVIPQGFSLPSTDWTKSLIINRWKVILRGMRLPSTIDWESRKTLWKIISYKLYSKHSYFMESQIVEFTCPRSLGCKVRLPLKVSWFETQGYTQNRTNFSSQLEMSLVSANRKPEETHSASHWELPTSFPRGNLLQACVSSKLLWFGLQYSCSQ